MVGMNGGVSTAGPPEPPWIGVRTLSEFIFCPRAGILAFERTDDFSEPEEDLVRLDYFPQYTLALIEEQLAFQFGQVGAWGGRLAAGVLVVAIALLFGWRLFAAVAAVASVWIGFRMSRAVKAAMTFAEMRRQAMSASAKEPTLPLAKTEPVNWWELLQAGFDPIRLQEPYRDEADRVAGKPWRILRKGTLRIPVIRIGEEHYEGARYWIGAQHELRLATYARLISACEGGEAPFGVVLFGNLYQGVAVPIKAALIDQSEEALAGLRAALAGTRSNIVPPPPGDRRCFHCPCGLPKRAGRTTTASGPKPHLRMGKDGVVRHSECGDRFSWTPPHDVAEKLSMLPTVDAS